MSNLEETTAEAEGTVVTRQLSTSPTCMDNPQWMHTFEIKAVSEPETVRLFSAPAASFPHLSPLKRNCYPSFLSPHYEEIVILPSFFSTND